jgi:hypothetical protein
LSRPTACWIGVGAKAEQQHTGGDSAIRVVIRQLIETRDKDEPLVLEHEALKK